MEIPTRENQIRIGIGVAALIVGLIAGITIEKRSYERQFADRLQNQVFGALQNTRD